jgi:hypothetical protein
MELGYIVSLYSGSARDVRNLKDRKRNKLIQTIFAKISARTDFTGEFLGLQQKKFYHY